MDNVLINRGTMTDIAGAIREKAKSTQSYKPADMPAAIKNLSTELPSIQVTIDNPEHQQLAVSASWSQPLTSGTLTVPNKVNLSARVVRTDDGYQAGDVLINDVKATSATIDFTTDMHISVTGAQELSPIINTYTTTNAWQEYAAYIAFSTDISVAHWAVSDIRNATLQPNERFHLFMNSDTVVVHAMTPPNKTTKHHNPIIYLDGEQIGNSRSVSRGHGMTITDEATVQKIKKAYWKGDWFVPLNIDWIKQVLTQLTDWQGLISHITTDHGYEMVQQYYTEYARNPNYHKEGIEYIPYDKLNTAPMQEETAAYNVAWVIAVQKKLFVIQKPDTPVHEWKFVYNV